MGILSSTFLRGNEKQEKPKEPAEKQTNELERENPNPKKQTKLLQRLKRLLLSITKDFYNSIF